MIARFCCCLMLEMSESSTFKFFFGTSCFGNFHIHILIKNGNIALKRNTPIAPIVVYMMPLLMDPINVPVARAIQQLDCVLPFTISVFTNSTVMLSEQTSLKQINAEMQVNDATNHILFFINKFIKTYNTVAK